MGTTWDLRVATGPERRIFTPQYNMDQNAEAATGFFTGLAASFVAAKSVQAHHPDPRAGSEESRHLAFAQLAFWVCVCENGGYITGI